MVNSIGRTRITSQLSDIKSNIDDGADIGSSWTLELHDSIVKDGSNIEWTITYIGDGKVALISPTHIHYKNARIPGRITPLVDEVLTILRQYYEESKI